MLINALELDNITARQVMVPRTRIFSLPADLTLDEALSRVVDEQHSRVPIYDPQRGPEHIVGVLYAKDLMRWMRLRLTQTAVSVAATRISQMKVHQIMHDVLVVPETKSLFELLVEFQTRKRHLAMVVDEFGSTAGVISVEDVLEQVVGELEDEFDVATPPAVTDVNAPLTLDGAVNIRDLESQYDIALPQDEGFETLAGFVLSRLQKMPTGGESFEYQNRRYIVDRMDGHRIAQIRIELIKPSGSAAQNAAALAPPASEQEPQTKSASAQKASDEDVLQHGVSPSGREPSN
jgi:CBS domain containing-hemolysin-like protein